MITVNENRLYTENELRELVEDKIMFKPRLKDIDGFIYKVEKLYPFHVLMESEFGYKRCFKYSEVFYRLN